MEIDRLNSEINERGDLLKDMMREETNILERETSDLGSKPNHQRRSNIADRNKLTASTLQSKSGNNDLESSKLSINELNTESRNSHEGSKKQLNFEAGIREFEKLKNSLAEKTTESDNLNEKKLIRMLQKQLEQKDNEVNLFWKF